ncbi:hypothetical protein VZT92_016859 [Zoarces viviparus]|uniref:Uncharacterized protein n=1 Tax=Zoarces viviparus TaxID=48416 RepID=A0AAW1EP23_ZOAVI
MYKNKVLPGYLVSPTPNLAELNNKPNVSIATSIEQDITHQLSQHLHPAAPPVQVQGQIPERQASLNGPDEKPQV